MKVTRTVLRDFMLKQAIINHYELRITDKNAMFYEIKNAIEWYEEVTD